MSYEPANGEQWMARRNCTQSDAETFFANEPVGLKRSRHVRQAEAKELCNGSGSTPGCLVRTECLTFALEHNEQWGVWGGLDEDQRAALKSGAA